MYACNVANVTNFNFDSWGAKRKRAYQRFEQSKQE